jgi:hypothetical protein
MFVFAIQMVSPKKKDFSLIAGTVVQDEPSRALMILK